MGRFELTDEHKKFIRENRLKMSGKKMAEHFGCSDGVVYRYMRANGLSVSRAQSAKFRAEALRGRTSFTPEEDAYIKENYLTIPVKRLASDIGRSGTGVKIRLRQLGLKIPKELARKRALDSQFQKGMVSHNKGKKQEEYMTPEGLARVQKNYFKKGHTPHNTRYDGHERITKDGYIEVRISRGEYRLKHLHQWEQENGPLPEGHCLRCIDGNIKNCDPENWKLITRAENMKLNSIRRFPPELQKTISLVSSLRKKINQLKE